MEYASTDTPHHFWFAPTFLLTSCCCRRHLILSVLIGSQTRHPHRSPSGVQRQQRFCLTRPHQKFLQTRSEATTGMRRPGGTSNFQVDYLIRGRESSLLLYCFKYERNGRHQVAHSLVVPDLIVFLGRVSLMRKLNCCIVIA